METGSVLELSKRSGRIAGSVVSGNVLVDGGGVGEIGSAVLRERRLLSQEGIFAVMIAINKETGVLAAEPEVISKGFVFAKESEELIEEAKAAAKEQAQAFAVSSRAEWGTVKTLVKSAIKSSLYSKTKRVPLIMLTVIEVE
jgi:ribonuclease J